MIKNYKDLEVWKLSIDLVTDIYKITEKLPDNEKFGLANQLRRASVSIPSNIAEGSIRRSKPEFARFVNISCGSAAEVETQLIICCNLKYINQEKLNEFTLKINRILAMLFKLQESLLK